MALRSIKLDHKDLTDDLEAAQRESYLFPPTPPRPDPGDQTKPWEQTPNANGILTHPTKRTTLPIAAFPGFTIRNQSKARGGLLGWLSTTFGFQSERGVELNIPVAETYGIPSIIAAGELEQFCSGKEYPNRCTDQTLRRHLAFVTPLAFEPATMPDEAAPGQTEAQSGTKLPAAPARRYKYPLEIVLVNRVYLARYIDQRVNGSRSAGTRLGSSDESGPASEKGTDRDDTKENGAALSFSKEDGQSIRQTFLRPIAIGYRAVKRLPNPDIVETTNIAASATVQECLADAANPKPRPDCRVALGSVPPLAINATQPSGADTQKDTDDPKRYRLYLHTAGQPEDIIAKARTALKTGGYVIQGEDSQADTDTKKGFDGAGVDYFNDVDGNGAASVSKIVTAATSAVVPRRRQSAYNSIGVLGVWLPDVQQQKRP